MKNFKRLALALMVGGVCATASAQDFQEDQEFQRELVKKDKIISFNLRGLRSKDDLPG